MKKIICLFIIFLMVGSVNAQPWFCDGTNIVSAMGNFEFDTAHYQPGWGGASEDYTASYAEGVFSVSFSHATTEKWQSLFFFDATTSQNVGDAGAEKVYFYSYDIETDVKIGTLTLQFKKADDGTICSAADVVDLPAGTHTISGLATVPTGVHPFQRLLFDFAWTDSCNIKISNFTVCDGYKGIDIGSMMGSGLDLYPNNDNDPTVNAYDGNETGNTIDYKIVTIEDKTWVWTKVHGSTIMGDVWAAQLRYWNDSLNRKVENQVTSRANDNTEAYGTIESPETTPPGNGTFFLALDGYVFTQTEVIEYDWTIANSAVGGDETAPDFTNVQIVAQDAASVTLAFTAADDNDVFYVIEDAENNYKEVFFFDTAVLQLELETDYEFRIIAIDFSGNKSNVKVISVYGTPPVMIVEGTIRAVDFKLDSRSLDELVVEGICNDTNETFGDAYVRIYIDGAWVGGASPQEWKPQGVDVATGVPSYCLRIPSAQIPGWESGKVIRLAFGYILSQGVPAGQVDWTQYVNAGDVLTDGENAGALILHEIGTGVDIEIPEAIEDLARYSQFKVYSANGVLSAKGNTLPANMTLYNVAGQKVLEVKNANSANVSNLRSGAYFLRIRTNSGAVEVHKIIL